MKKFMLIAFYFLFFNRLFSASIWNEGNRFYRISIKSGDILTIKFSDKTGMKYRLEEKVNNYFNKEGVKGKGEIFAFYPDAGASQNDTSRKQISLDLKTENNFTLKGKVVSIDESKGTLEGLSTLMIGGEFYKIGFSGEFDIYSVNSDYSINSTDIYNLNFKVFREQPQITEVLSENDLVFQTNFTEVYTNYVFDPTNNLTNLVISTNFSAFEVKLKGVSGKKRQELILNYLRSIINTLFY